MLPLARDPRRPRLTHPVPLGDAIHAPSRVLFGPHPTNLGRGRALSDRHLAYYRERAAGGTGVLVTEVASVTDDDWPYERAPLAAECAPGWSALAEACAPYRTVVLAGLGHAGLEGTSAWSQAVGWAPSAVPDLVTRELPAALEQDGIDRVVAGFAAAARSAVGAGLAGVELNAGTHSLLRQFLSPLTNRRDDGYGTDRTRFLREALDAVRAAIGRDRTLALRLTCDEGEPGLTAETSAATVAVLAGRVDLLTVVRGGYYTASDHRPTARVEQAFNARLCRAMRDAAGGADGRAAVVLQGSVVDADVAQRALDLGVADLVEMTRAQIADPNLVRLVRAGTPDRVRPCLLCNQACQVRDHRNPLVSCVVEPRAGHETSEPPVERVAAPGRDVLVVGGGPAGLEAARTLALAGHRVTIAERTDRLGGTLARAAVGPGRERLAALTDWLEAECRLLGVEIQLRTTTFDVGGFTDVVVATGSVPRPRPADVLDVLDVLSGATPLPPGPVVVDDPTGGPVGVALAEMLAGERDAVALVSPDPILGSRLDRTGDLAGANFRLEALGVRRELRSKVREVGAGTLVLEDVWTGERREVPCAALIDCGHRLPADGPPGTVRAGDCVAPRTVLEAVLEGRRAAQRIASNELVAAGENGGWGA